MTRGMALTRNQIAGLFADYRESVERLPMVDAELRKDPILNAARSGLPFGIVTRILHHVPGKRAGIDFGVGPVPDIFEERPPFVSAKRRVFEPVANPGRRGAIKRSVAFPKREQTVEEAQGSGPIASIWRLHFAGQGVHAEGQRRAVAIPLFGPGGQGIRDLDGRREILSFTSNLIEI